MKKHVNLSILLVILLAAVTLLIGCDRAEPVSDATTAPPDPVTEPLVEAPMADLPASRLPVAEPETEHETAPETAPVIWPGVESTPAVPETEPVDLVHVRFIDWNGKLVDGQTVDRYDSVEAPGWLLCPAGYRLSWKDEDGIQYEAEDFITAMDDMIVRAELTPMPVKIEFVQGNRRLQTVEASFGEEFVLPEFSGDIPHGYHFGGYTINGYSHNAGDTVCLDSSLVEAAQGAYRLTVKAYLTPHLLNRWIVSQTEGGMEIGDSTLYWTIPLLETFSEDLFKEGYKMKVTVTLTTSKGKSHCEKSLKIAMCDTPDINIWGDEGFGPSVIGEETQSLKRYGELTATAIVDAGKLSSYKLNVALRADVGYIFDGAFVKNTFIAEDLVVTVEFYK